MKKIAYALSIIVICSGIAYGMVNFGKVYDTVALRAQFMYAYAHFTIYRIWDGNWNDNYYVALASDNASELGIPVLLYHGIVTTPDRFSLTQGQFANHMQALKEAGYQTISMTELSDYLRGEQVELPPRPFVLTFDDGRKDSFFGANPILALYGFQATMFLPTMLFDTEKRKNSYYLSISDIDDMANNGRWEIESHAIQKNGGYVPIDAVGGMGYLLSNREWRFDLGRLETQEEYRTRIAQELVGSWVRITARTGKTPVAFSYPFGAFGQQTTNNPDAKDTILDIVGDYYPLAFRQVWPSDSGYTLNYPGEDTRILRRIEPSPTLSGKGLVQALQDGSTKKLPYTDDFGTNEGWKVTWGKVTINDTHSELSIKGSGSGAFMFLDGSYPWGDYQFTLSAKHATDTVVTLVGRYVNPENFTTCVFDGRGVWIEETKDGVTTDSTGTSLTMGDNISVTYGLRAVGNTFGCERNGELITSLQFNATELPEKGGIGIQIWSPQSGGASLSLLHLRVDPLTSWEEKLREMPKTILATSTIEKSPIKTAPIIQKQSVIAKPNSDAGQGADVSTTPLPPKVENIDVVQETPPPPPDKPIVLFDDSGIAKPFTEYFSGIEGWRAVGGKVVTTPAGFLLQTATDTTSALYVLRGSESWSDYITRATVRWVSGSTFSIIARRTSDRDYMECAFIRGSSSGSVIIYAYENGIRIKLFQSPTKLLLFGNDDYAKASLGTTVKGTTISCDFNNFAVITYDHARLSLVGGVALREWDNTPGNMAAEISSFSVQPIR